MKKLISGIRPAWQFWAVLLVGFLLGGVRTSLIFLGFMIAILVLGVVVSVLSFTDRPDLVRAGTFENNHWLIQLLCRIGQHTRGDVVLENPKTFEARLWLMEGSRDLEARVGRANCVSCQKDLLVHSFKAMDRINNGRPYWTLMDKKDCEEFEKVQRGESWI